MLTIGFHRERTNFDHLVVLYETIWRMIILHSSLGRGWVRRVEAEQVGHVRGVGALVAFCFSQASHFAVGLYYDRPIGPQFGRNRMAVYGCITAVTGGLTN